MRLLHYHPRTARPPGRRGAAFTLIEMLMVIAIIALLAVIALPSMKGISGSNIIAAADRQLLDDISLARHKAITSRTTVHIVFVPPSYLGMSFNTADPQDAKIVDRLKTGGYTTYALFAERSVGDQPGQPHYRYVSAWKSLPEGVFIAAQKFDPPLQTDAWFTTVPVGRPFRYLGLPFPTSNGLTNLVPHIAFDSQGRLVKFDSSGQPHYNEEVIELARGSILAVRDDNGVFVDYDVRENPLNNSIDNFIRIRIDGLTGRARVEKPEIAP